MTINERLRYTTVATDCASTFIAWLIFNCVRYFMLDSGHSSFLMFISSAQVVAGQIMFTAMMLAIYWISGYYNDMLSRSRIHDALSTAGSALAGTMCVLVGALLNDMTPDRITDWLLLFYLWSILTLMVVIPRMVIDNHIISSVRKGCITMRGVTVGDVNTDRLSSTRGIRITESVTDGSDLSRALAISSDETDCYIVSSTMTADNIYNSVAALLPSGLPIYMDFSGAMSTIQRRMPKARSLDTDMLVDISGPHTSAPVINLKRIGDIVFSALALPLVAPLLIFLCIAIKLDSPGPALYFQKRAGYRRRIFKMAKLRTMHNNAEPHGPALAMPGDPRITRTGRFLRKYRLDELPQLWNILRGDMSFVGPRPERPVFVDKIMQLDPSYAFIHTVRPGLTSWGMVKYGYASSPAQMVERMRYDLMYLDNIGFGIDMKIILHTLNTVVSGKGL